MLRIHLIVKYHSLPPNQEDLYSLEKRKYQVIHYFYANKHADLIIHTNLRTMTQNKKLKSRAKLESKFTEYSSS
jgi:hypothetical protein